MERIQKEESGREDFGLGKRQQVKGTKGFPMGFSPYWCFASSLAGARVMSCHSLVKSIWSLSFSDRGDHLSPDVTGWIWLRIRLLVTHRVTEEQVE